MILESVITQQFTHWQKLFFSSLAIILYWKGDIATSPTIALHGPCQGCGFGGADHRRSSGGLSIICWCAHISRCGCPLTALTLKGLDDEPEIDIYLNIYIYVYYIYMIIYVYYIYMYIIYMVKL